MRRSLVVIFLLIMIPAYLAVFSRVWEQRGVARQLASSGFVLPSKFSPTLALAEATGLEISVLTDQLNSHAKQLLVFDSAFDERVSQIRIFNDQPSSAVFLRGTRPGVAPGFLYQTAGIPIQSP